LKHIKHQWRSCAERRKARYRIAALGGARRALTADLRRGLAPGSANRDIANAIPITARRLRAALLRPSIRDIANAILADQSGANHGEAAQGQHSPRNDAAHRKSARFNTISQQAETILPGSTALTSSLR